MFRNARYMTCGVSAELGLDIWAALWAMVDGLVASGHVEVDYLQVFDLEVESAGGVVVQRVVHHQEVPPYRSEHILIVSAPAQAKVFVIDDGDHSTMLLAEEY